MPTLWHQLKCKQRDERYDLILLMLSKFKTKKQVADHLGKHPARLSQFEREIKQCGHTLNKTN